MISGNWPQKSTGSKPSVSQVGYQLTHSNTLQTYNNVAFFFLEKELGHPPNNCYVSCGRSKKTQVFDESAAFFLIFQKRI